LNRIDQKFQQLKEAGHKAVSIFLTAGYPSISATEHLVLELENSGVDFFEIGFPFSDPIADGPVIQKASEISLKSGMTWNRVLRLVQKIRKRSQAPLIFMGYANVLFCRGWKSSLEALAHAGFDGLIIPDLIPEESEDLRKLCLAQGLKLIYLAAPTSSQERLKKIGQSSSGFTYAVSVTGVTGARKILPSHEIKCFLKNLHAFSKVPTVLGFGISDTQQCQIFKKEVDGFVIGSKMIQILGQKGSVAKLVARAKRFIQPFRRTL
jgi:tryptophan synthase alpha chain